MAATTYTPELGDVVTYNGRRGVVTGFGSLAAAFPEFSEMSHPSGFVVRVEMEPYAIGRTLRMSELRRSIR